MGLLVTTFAALLACLFLVQGGAALQSQEEQLTARLLASLGSTGKIARPVSDYRNNVSVELSVSLVRVVWVKDYSGEMELWVTTSWQDSRLRWNPADFGGLAQFTLPANLVWLPDIRSFFGGYKPDKETSGRVVVYNSGKVLYVLPARVRARCQSSDRRSAVCNVTLGSWVHSALQMDLTLGEDPIKLSELEMSDWNVTKATAERVETIYPCCPEAYLSARFSISLRQASGQRSPSRRRKNKDRRKRPAEATTPAPADDEAY